MVITSIVVMMTRVIVVIVCYQGCHSHRGTVARPRSARLCGRMVT
jgi:hypothetical protein